MLTVSYIVNPLLMLALPIGLGLVLARRLAVPWRLFFVGAATFIGSQVVHIPLNVALDRLVDAGLLLTPPAAYYPLFNAVVLGLSAGVCEEVARYVSYRWWIKDARHWRQALMVGAGHGGIEAILVGLYAGLLAFNLIVASHMDLTTQGLNAEQLAATQAWLAAGFSIPWWYPLLGAFERVMALTNHVALAVLVLQACKRRSLLWLLAAILWHAALNGVALYLGSVLPADTGPLWAEAAVALFALAALAVIWALREPFMPAPPEPLPAPTAKPLPPARPTAEALDKSRYQ